MTEFKNFQLGSDAEVFLMDNDGTPVPVCGLIGGTKESPLVPYEGYGLQEDNVMAEFNIPPASTKEEWCENIATGLQITQEFCNPYQLNICPSVEFPEEILMQNIQAMTFGCSPFFDVWEKKNTTFKAKDVGNLRFAGGHIHISWENPTDMEQRIRVGRMCDLFLLIPSLSEDEDQIRRDYYGRPGFIRPKVYGIEYRSLSNYWLTNPGIIWDRVKGMFLALENGDDFTEQELKSALEHESSRNELLAYIQAHVDQAQTMEFSVSHGREIVVFEG
jgi:hypothetical protein